MVADLDDPELETPGDFSDTIAWWDNQDLTADQQTVKKIHYFMRYEHKLVEGVEKSLSAGTRWDYVKALNKIVVHGEDPEAVTNGTAAMKKAEAALENGLRVAVAPVYGLKSQTMED